MKKLKYTIVVVLSYAFIGCNSNSDKKDTNNNLTHDTTLTGSDSINQTVCKPYFDFDKVEYYYIDIDEGSFNDLQFNDKRNKKEQQLLDIVEGGHLNSMKDTTNIDIIKKLGYETKVLNTNLNLSIQNIFCERKHKDWFAAACIAIYRDILVFKQRENIVGVAKICFTCRQHEIVGTKLNTEYFGQSGDFEKLYDILRNREGL